LYLGRSWSTPPLDMAPFVFALDNLTLAAKAGAGVGYKETPLRKQAIDQGRLGETRGWSERRLQNAKRSHCT
jgi:hypothetical protein